MSSNPRNFRRRGGNDDITTAATKPPPPTTTTTTAAMKPKKKSLLSFADDEEDSPFTTSGPAPKPSAATSAIKKPLSSSQKLTSAKDRFTPTLQSSSSVLSNLQPQAGTYTKEALLELQKNTKTLVARSRPEYEPEHRPGPKESVIVLKGLAKPVLNDETELKDGENEDIEKDSVINKLGSMGVVEEIGGIIPDRATIEAIRAKRKRLRQVRPAAPDYLVLDEGGNHGEEPEFQARIGFYGEKIDKRGVFDDFEDEALEKDGGRVVVVSYGSEDEEDKMWEEQVRKGLGKRMDDGGSNRGGANSVSVAPVVVQSSVEKFKLGNSASMYSSVQRVATYTIGGTVGGLPDLNVLSISQQAEVAKKALLQNMGRLKESHGRTVASLHKTEENLSASLSNVTALENLLTAVAEKYIFIQKHRDFWSSLLPYY